MNKKHNMKPFEDPESLQKLCAQNDASLFMLGNHSKKRPQNLIIGRLYDSKILDMVELGVDQFNKMAKFPTGSTFDPSTKPLIIFQGERFEYSDQFIKIRSLFSGTASVVANVPLDVFRVADIATFDVAQAKKIMVFTATGEKTIRLRCFTSNIPSPNEATKENSSDSTPAAAVPVEDKKPMETPKPAEEKKPEEAKTTPVEEKKEPIPAPAKKAAVESTLIEVGPSMTFTVRRNFLASEEVLKEAMKKPKMIVKAKKVVSQDTVTICAGKEHRAQRARPGARQAPRPTARSLHPWTEAHQGKTAPHDP